MRHNPSIAFVVILLGLLAIPAPAMAQCDPCAPIRTEGHELDVTLRYSFHPNVPDDVRIGFNAAGGRVMSALQAAGRPHADISEGGTDFVVVYDPSLDDRGVWAEESWNSATGRTIRITIGSDVRLTTYDFQLEVFGHEILHAVGYDEVEGCPQGTSIMVKVKVPWAQTLAPYPTAIDECALSRDRDVPEGERGRSRDGSTPILIDLDGGGLRFADEPVSFDIRGDGQSWRVMWPRPASGSAFLALDRNGDGTISNGRELFGDSTPLGWQAHGLAASNGFDALAAFDSRENGGNGDGYIDERDSVFGHLLLWTDDDCNGVSTPNELVSAWDGGVRWLSLDARECHRTDRTGTRYAYRAKIGLEREHGTTVQRFAYDVIFFVW